MYLRPASGLQDPARVAPFSVNATVCTSGDFASPESKLYGTAGMKISSIPDGPKKGDLIVIGGKTYLAQELFIDAQADWVDIKLRLAGK